MRKMTLCPNCGTIQKEGVRCPNCNCPVTQEQRDRIRNEENKVQDQQAQRAHEIGLKLW